MECPLLPLIRRSQLPRRRRDAVDATALTEARAILDDLAARGDAAALEHAQRLGDLRAGQPCVYSASELAAARDELPVAQRNLLERTAARIQTFARAQRACLRDLTLPLPGGAAGHTCIPVRSAGCYAPGGRFPLPSSVLMTAVTARAAGVAEVWVASPRPAQVTLAAAAIAGADGLLAIGGAQAVGALSLGLLGVPACDMVVGPGNRWVTAAKQLISSDTGIDMLAGPSELLILAHETNDAPLIAADLLAQAEHDEDAVPMLVTTSDGLRREVERELAVQLRSLPTASTARASLGRGFSLLVDNLGDAINVCDQIGPEHLEIMSPRAPAIAKRIRNAGSAFVGPMSAEVLGDYGAGPNHVLPTGGTARFRAGLSVFTFLRSRTWLRLDDQSGAVTITRDARDLARLESLEGHARSAEFRLAERVSS